MLINELSLTNFRGFTNAQFSFQKGFNLIVGVNGVGKTTALEALRIALSNIMPAVTSTKSRKEIFSFSDIQIDKYGLQLNCTLEVNSEPFDLLITKQATPIHKKESQNIREQTFQIEDKVEVSPRLINKYSKQKIINQPVAIYYSSYRSLITEKTPAKSTATTGQAGAFAEALSPKREFNIALFADWFKAQEALAKENKKYIYILEIIRNAIYTFLPSFKNLEVIKDPLRKTTGYTFIIEKKDKKLNLSQLSDGERGVLSMVMDISRRLSLANPTMSNPLEGTGVVLIDELDLHLHPKWQRTIISDLSRTFPNLQFIATTHSPQSISALSPDRIQIVDMENEVENPIRSFGLDMNSILKFVMEDKDRIGQSEQAIQKVEKLVDKLAFEKARKQIRKYKKEGLDLTEWAVFEARMANLEILGNEEDN